jgi:parallel beta-helix repeat protein
LIFQFSFSGYTTPNTGVKWNFDSLVVNSAGMVTGTFPTYNVNDTIYVSANDLIDIRKGSVIRIAYRKGITVRGSFLSIGTKDSLITFTKLDSTWLGIRFEDSAVDSMCTFEYSVIESSILGLNFVSASPTVHYSTIKNTGLISGTLAGSGNYGVQCFNSNAVFRFDSIYNNAQYGFNINSNASPIIENCVIYNNNLQGTGFKNQISIGTQGINSPVIKGNKIFHTVPNIKVGAISISAFFAGSGSNAVIENNELHHNAYGIALASQGTSTLNVIIRNNMIYNNTYSDPNAAGSGINFNSLAPSVQNTIVAGNTISGNSWGITILGNAKPNLGDITNSDTTDDGRNIFLNNKNRDTVFALYNNSAGRIQAQNNYWGYSSPDSVSTVIIESSDVMSLGKVVYEPYLHSLPLFTSSNRMHQSPESFTLFQNYPNPFNPSTVISFQILVNTHVTLKIYDALGREVATVINEMKKGGIHTAEFNAEKFASGIYFYRLQAGEFVETKKMSLIK